MSKDLNQCNFIGRLGRDIELKYMPNGNAVANFSIACSDDYKDKSGQKVEQTNWINIVIFGKLAEIAGQYVAKGSQIYVSGKQVTRKWQDQTGADRYTTEIVASELQMLGGKSKPDQENNSQPTRSQQSSVQSQPAKNKESGFEDYPDDIPF